jgi:hypothetical protein
MCDSTSKRLCNTKDCEKCFERSFASHERSKYWSKRNELSARDVFKNSNSSFLFDCNGCGHELTLCPRNINSGQWCAYCNKGKLCNDLECKYCFQRSFASHPMSLSWSPRNPKSVREYSLGSEAKCWFKCKDCDHEFNTTLFIIKQDKLCPFCSNQKLCEDEDCLMCCSKSCQSNDLICRSWSTKNTFDPRDVFLKSNKKVYLNCDKCNHELYIIINKFNTKEGCCKYCTNKVLCSDNNCKLCFDKSFASHPKVSCWSSKNTKNPRDVFKGSESLYKFNCDKCSREFESRAYNVLTGYWCPYCKNKSEGKLLEYLEKEYPEIKKQLRFDWCINEETKQKMPFDFGISENKVLIELDGEQHFKQVSNWGSCEDVQKKDIIKIKKCIESGYSIIHLYQPFVWSDMIDWKCIIKSHVDSLKSIDKPQCIFIGPYDKYKSHIDAVSDYCEVISKEYSSS